MNVNVQKIIKIISSNNKVISCSNGKENIDLSVHKFKDICRFCLFGPAEVNLFKQLDYQTVSLIQICLNEFSLKVDPDNDFPANICNQCKNKIKEFITFKSSILQNELIFKRAIEISLKYKSQEIEIAYNNISDDSDSNSIFKEDISKTQNPKLYKCKYCNDIFTNSLEYRKHFKKEQETRKDIFSTCIICKKFFAKIKLEAHMKKHTKTQGLQSFQCDICKKNYSTKRNLDRHYLTHTGMPHVCGICGKGFREANLLKDHLNIHNGVYPYLCTLCGKNYPTSSALRWHRVYIHTEKKRKVYKYPKKTENNSIKKSSKKGSFPCEICGKVYSTKTIVNYHVLTHSEEKKFQCNDCGKMFANKSVLGDHRRIHRLAYKCSYCERSFAYAASLETHINSHTGEKPHGCSICGKSYSNRSHLKEHMRNHTGERPYSCTICGKTFTAKGNLNTHLKIHKKI